MNKLILFLLLLCQPLLAVTYYVKPTGDNAKSGLTEALAWKNINKACSTLVAGDTVLIRAGRYDETSAYSGGGMGYDAGGHPREYGVRPANSGTLGSPIVFKGYPGDVRPLIIGKSDAAANDLRAAAYLQSKEYLIYDSLEFRFGSIGLDLGDSRYNIVRNCIVDSTLGTQNNGGIAFYYGEGTENTHSNIIENNELFANGLWEGSTPVYVNKVNSSGIHNYHCDSCIFRNNIIHDQYSGICLKRSARYTEIYGNVMYNIYFAGMWTVYGGCGACTDFNDAIWHNNVVYHAGNCLAIGSGSIASQTPPDLDSNIYWYNNTCDCNSTGGGANGTYGRWAKSFFFNNIIYKPVGNPSTHVTAFGFGMASLSGGYTYPTDFYEDYNLFYGLGDANTGKYYDWTPLAEMTLNYWKDHLPTGVVAGSGAHNTIADPLFVDATNHDYHLSEYSPAASGGRGGSFTFYPGTGRETTITLPTYRGAYALGTDSFPPVDTVLSVSLNPLVFTRTIGDDDDSIAFIVNTVPDASVTFSVSLASSWIGTPVLDNDTTPGGSFYIPLSINALDTLGQYRDSLTVSCAGTTIPSVIVPITMNLIDSFLVVEPTSFLLSEVFNPKTPCTIVSQYLTVTTLAEVSAIPYTLDYTNRFISSAYCFSCVTPEAAIISIDCSALGVGVYYDTITVTSAGATNSPISVPVVLTISVPGTRLMLKR